MDIKKQPDYIIERWDEETRKNIRKKSGAYALYLGKMCLYVGVSQDLVGRVHRFFTSTRRMENKILCMVVNYCKDNNIKLIVKIYLHDANNLRELEYKYIKCLYSKLNDQNNPYLGRNYGRQS